MKQTKPDRWERIAESFRSMLCDEYICREAIPEFARALRREHQAVVRLIKQIEADYINSEYRVVCADILDQLKKRAQ